MSLRMNRDRRSVQQDLGSGFHFEPDNDALQSILNNEGVERAVLARLSSLTPAKHIPGSFKNDADKLEFFEGASGKVFFRRKVTTPKNERVNVKRFKNNPTAAKFAPMRMGPPSTQKNLRAGPQSTQKNLGRSPLSVKSSNTLNVPINKFATEKKKPKVGIPIHRESISEKKPAGTRSFLPKPNCGSRKSLYFPKSDEINKNEPVDKSNESFEFVRPAAVNFPLEPLTALTRESLRLLPRESRAWLDKIPRDSVTFREIEKLMNSEDRNCVNDDDTCAFERMEHRIKPDVKPTQIVIEETVAASTEAADEYVLDNSLDQSHESNGSFEARENELRTPKQVRIKQMEVNSAQDQNKENLETDLRNLSLNENQMVQINSKSYESPNSKKYKKKHEMFGKNLNESPKLNVAESATSRAPPLVKSLSMIDLNQDKLLPLAKSSSVDNLSQDLEISGLVSLDQMQDILCDLDRYRAEQDDLERQKEQIFKKIKERREQFKELWGVSPKSVNKIRTVIPIKKVPSPKKFLSPICESPATSVPSVTSVPADASSSAPPVLSVLSATPPLLTETPPSSKPSRHVRVRFNSGANLVKVPSPVQLEGSPFSLNSSPLPERTSASNSFSALRSSFSFLKTPVAAQHPKKRMVEEFAVTNSGRKEETRQAVPTPVALRSLSDRVHAELAKLYADSSDECEETQTLDLMKKLTF